MRNIHTFGELRVWYEENTFGINSSGACCLLRTKVEPETPGPETPGIGELIYRGNALFAEYEDKWLGYEPWEMTKSAEGLSGEGGSFVYWWDHRTEAKTSDELHAMCDIPEEKLLAMSTANLVRTCYIYPHKLDLCEDCR